MISRAHYLIVSIGISLAIGQARAQEAPRGSLPTGSPATAGPEEKYADLTHSKDPKTKGLAERYLNLLKYQEWGTASGKIIVAKYVSHDPDLRHVKLAVPRGIGKDRTVKEYNVDVEILNKISQARVKQIDTLQKKLDELAVSDKQGDAGIQAGPGGPMRDERAQIAATSTAPKLPH